MVVGQHGMETVGGIGASPDGERVGQVGGLLETGAGGHEHTYAHDNL